MPTPRATTKPCAIDSTARSVAIVGAGVSGLSTAIQLSEAGFDVSIISGQTPSETTSAVAAAFWYPFRVGGYRRSWASISYSTFLSLKGIEEAGVSTCRSIEYIDLEDDDAQEEIRGHWWRHLPGIEYQYKGDEPIATTFGDADDLRGELTFHHKVSFTVPVINMGVYLSYLEKWYAEVSGRKIEYRWCDDLGELSKRYDYVVNCAGYGARELVGDEEVKAISGQLVRIDGVSPGAALVFLQTGRFANAPVYIVPRHSGSQDTVLGGSLIEQIGYPARKDLPDFNPALSAMIRRRCEAFDPKLARRDVASEVVGLRPYRSTMRLEWCKQHSKKLIHNYGHGGGGVTLSWGCAARVCEMIEDAEATRSA